MTGLSPESESAPSASEIALVKRTQRQDLVKNLAISLLLASGLASIVRSVLLPHFRNPPLDISHRAFTQIVFTQRVVENLAALILILVCVGLYRRLRSTWTVAAILTPLLAVVNLAHHHWIIATVQVIAWVVLVVFRPSFSRGLDRLTWRKGIIATAVSVFIIVANVTYALFLHQRDFSFAGFSVAIQDALEYLFTMDLTVMGSYSRLVAFWLQFALVVNWVALAAAAFFIIKPLVVDPYIAAKDHQHARALVRTYGINPLSNVALERDKRLFFATEVDGFIAYTTVGSVVICAGDPICAPEDLGLLLGEFVLHVRKDNQSVCMCQTMPEFRGIYESLGFGSLKYGEEAMIDLPTFTTAGGKRMKLRQGVSRAAKLGVTVHEYRPLDGRDPSLERQIDEVSRVWGRQKGSADGETHSFMISSVGLDDPVDKRYFYAKDGDGAIQAFCVFVPYVVPAADSQDQGGTPDTSPAMGLGYMVDITRRAPGAAHGVMEAITVGAWETFKAEGVRSVSLGLSPLSNIQVEDEKAKIIPAILSYVYENLNSVYGFKTLHEYKKKYAPDSWEPRYLTFYPSRFTPQMAYGLIKCQNPEGVSKILLGQLKSLRTPRER